MVVHSLRLFSSRITRPLRIALASDLHGRDPREALFLLESARPDLICVAGDLFHSPWDDPTNALRFLKRSARIAPVVYTMGNHEGDGAFLNGLGLEEMGIIRLENQERRIGELWVGGFCDRLADGKSKDFAREFSQRSGFRLMLCHRPDYYLRYLKELNLDLVLAGHAHGGQIRVGKRGVYAPGQGLFCSYVSGLYHGRLAVSAGLANSVRVPRWNNPTELIVVELAVAKEETLGNLHRGPAS